MSCFGCCSRAKDGKKINRVESDPDNMFGDHFEGVNPERRKIEASRHADCIVKVIADGGSFKKSDLEVIEPAPIFVSTTSNDKKKTSKAGGGG